MVFFLVLFIMHVHKILFAAVKDALANCSILSVITMVTYYNSSSINAEALSRTLLASSSSQIHILKICM